MGNSLINLQRYPEALIAYMRASELEDPNPETFVCIAACYEQMKNWELSIQNYKHALKIDTNYEDAWFGIGCCMLAQDKSFEAIHFLKKAIQANEDNERFWLNLARAEYKTGNVISSLEAYEKVCELDPFNAEMWIEWSHIYYDQGDYERAISLITSGIDELPDNAELYYRAAAYMLSAGHHKEAFNFLENALILDFDMHTILFEFFTQLETQKALYKIIDQFRDKKDKK
jgi:tetratricopeptide (TPR) repeat protein